jgi:amino acid adenylation domain-containing protein
MNAPAHDLLRQVRAWNATAADVAPLTIQALFGQHVARDPDHPALFYQGESVSYRELDLRSDRVAGLLRGQRLGKEALVGVMTDRTPDMVYAMLGILKAGAAYVPIDPDYPSARIQYLLEDSRCGVLLTDRDDKALGELQFDGRIERIGALVADAAYAPHPADAAPAPADGDPRDLAYVIYTSGSTGRPKGAMVEHRGIVNFIGFYQEKFGITPRDRIVQFASISFAASVSEIFMALLTGATLYLVPKPVILNHRQFEDYLLEHRISIATLPPHYIVELDPLRNALRVVVTAGSPAHWNTVEKWRPHLTYYNAYGTSETSVGVSTFNASAFADARTGGVPTAVPTAVPIGIPNNNTRFYILDDHGALAAPMQPGELCVSGVCVGRGYLRRPELTDQKFVANPFEPGERMYRTGDLARWHADGNVEVLGRIDDQVKINGHRIEPDEIAALLLQHPAVEDAVVVVRDVNGEARLCAYCVAPTLEHLDAVRAFVAERLPDYMRPAFLVQIDAVPINLNGKLDKPALPDPRAASLNRVAWQAPRTPGEASLAAVWREVLGLEAEQLGIYDNFFHIGGDSVRAIQIVARLYAQGRQVDVADLFQFPTVAALAPLVSARALAADAAEQTADDAAVLTDAQRRALLAEAAARFATAPALAVEAAYALSPLQSGMYFDHFGPDPAAYFVQSEFHADGALDPALFAASVDDLVARHEILRAVFTHHGLEQPLQVIVAGLPVDYAYRDLSDEPDQHAWLDAWMARDERHGLRLERHNAVRFRLFKLAPERFRVYICFHHIIMDGWCIGVIWDALRAAYRARAAGDVTAAAPGYRRYIAWLGRQDHGSALAYWQQTLAGYAAPASLAAKAPAGQAPGAFHTFPWSVDAALAQALGALCKRYQLTLNSVFKGLWAILLQRHTGTDDVVFGEVSAGRPPHLEHAGAMLGLFINTLPVRVRTGPDDDLVRLLRNVQAGTLAAQKHQHVSLAEIQSASPLRNGLLDHLLVFENFPDLDGDDATGWTVRAGRVLDRTNYPLTVTVLPGDDITVEFLFDQSRYTPATIARLARQLDTLLRQAVAHPLGAVAAMNPFQDDSDDRHAAELLGAAPVRPALGIHQLFEQQAGAAPERIAVHLCPPCDAATAVPGRRLAAATLSYRALNAHANKLAHHLAAAGVGPGARVAILLERSPEFIISLLAVLKAGAAYVPIDHSYPAARIRRILDVADPAVVISREAQRAPLESRAGVLDLDRDWHAIQDAPSGNPALPCRPGDLAQVLFTSGTTGQPKGVMLAHRGLVNHALFLQEQLALTPDDHVLQFAALGFDALNEEIFPALITGARVVLRAPDLPDRFEHLAQTIVRERISILDLPTAYWNHWVDALADGHFDPAGEGRLRRVIVGGEAISAKHVAQWQRRWPGIDLVNSYGPTEATVISTWYPVPPLAPDQARIPLGRPISNTRLHILDAEQRPLGVGRAGELWIGGAGLALGYLHDDALTAERFVEAAGGERRYRTGDWVELDEQGELHYLGRMDHQVKLRGFRIELDEVRQALLAHPHVRQALACVERHDGDAQLAAYVQLSAPLEAPTLRRFLRGRLPAQCVPNRLNLVRHWPLNGNGKIDQDRLQACGEAMPAGRADPNLTPLQQRLCAIWASVLGAPVTDVEQSFFELGGHSLQVVRLLARMRQELTVEVSMAGFSRHPTVARLARHIEDSGDGASGGSTDSSLVRLTAPGRDGTQPPLFVIHPIGGGVFCYAHLAAALAGQRAVYGLQSPGLDGPGAPADVPAMAAAYLAAIAEVAPRGPYCLAGWSMGGQIAHEMACQLRRRGETVDALVLIDSWHPSLLPAAADPLADFVGDLVASGGHDRPPPTPAGAVAEPSAWHAVLRERGLIPAELTAGRFETLYQVYRDNLHAMLGHTLGHYDGAALLLQAEQPAGGRAPVHGLGWGDAIARLQVRQVGGDHYTQLGATNARALAAWFGPAAHPSSTQ